MLIIVVFEEKTKKNRRKEKEMHIVTLWRLQYFCCTLQTTVFYTVVQRFMCAVVVCSLSWLHFYLYLLQESIFAYEKNTILYSFKSLVDTYTWNQRHRISTRRLLTSRFLLYLKFCTRDLRALLFYVELIRVRLN